MILEVLKADPKVLDTPEAPFARLSGGTNEAMEFTVRAWCQNADYWALYFDLNQKIAEKFAENHVAAPTARVITKAE